MNDLRPVIAAYRFRQGVGDPEIHDLLRRHRAALLRAKLTTDRVPFVLRSLEQPAVFVEIFEWVNEDAAKKAHQDPLVMDIWDEFARHCETVGVPFNALRESARSFAQFGSFPVVYEAPKPLPTPKPEPKPAAPKPTPKAAPEPEPPAAPKPAERKAATKKAVTKKAAAVKTRPVTKAPPRRTTRR